MINKKFTRVNDIKQNIPGAAVQKYVIHWIMQNCIRNLQPSHKLIYAKF